MKDGDVKLSRSIAICKYLIQKNKKDTRLYPLTDLKGRTKIDAYLDYDAMDLRGPTLDLVAQKKDPDSTVQTADDLKFAFNNGIRLLGIMIDSAEGKFFFGDEPSLADFAVFTTVFEACNHGGFDISEHSQIQTWYNRVADISAMNELLDQFK